MKNLHDLRNDIDKVDDELLLVLRKRKDIILKMAEYKSKCHLDIYDPQREKELIARLMQEAEFKDLDKAFIKALYRLILKNSKDEQKKSTRVIHHL